MNDHEAILSLLPEFGYRHLSTEDTGLFFESSDTSTCIIIDTDICSLKGYHYVDYTTRQNGIFHQYERVLRFSHDGDTSVYGLKREISFFLSDEDDPEQIKRSGRNRTEQDIDPTQPEAIFEDCFVDAFGHNRLNVLHKEFGYSDRAGMSRYVDYALFSGEQKFAIELNGESFHHPAVIGPEKYRSQLYKQNSLSYDGFKVFRWSMRGMQDHEKFIQELRQFFGNPDRFQPKAAFKTERPVDTFTLYRHQRDSLAHLEKERRKGRTTFLIVLPTGTGKTEIFIEDILRLKKESPQFSALIIVPTRKLREQTIARLKLRGRRLQCTPDIFRSNGRDVCVQTSAYMHRHYFKIDRSEFDYIVVDEAHHAAAAGLHRILEHFMPKHLVGVTATPDRLDQQRLEKTFGEYESMLTLEEAIEGGLIPPIRCYRIKSNIDLSEVRFNGKEYVKSDLQKTLLVPSRDELIAQMLVKYFGGPLRHKQGVVFCVDINHAERMARMLTGHDIPATAVSGRNTASSDKAMVSYLNGSVRFLCACDILTEGWDAPQTSILVMARPTFSRVLYTQQLGRGSRKYKDKEALYVLDVVDNYGAKLQPLSLHSLLGIGSYMPFDDVVKPKYTSPQNELTVLDGLFEDVRRIEPVDIFNYEEMYGDYLNEEQLARELFVSTGTVNAWLRKGDIIPDVIYPFGRAMLHFFDPGRLENIRMLKGLKKRTAETRKDDFIEFIEKRDYTYSFKIIFLLSFLKVRNDRGEAELPELLELYRAFYSNMFSKYRINEKKNSPYNRPDYLSDSAKMQQSLLRNPFEKFDRKRFFYHCKDLNYIAMDTVLNNQLSESDYRKIRTQMVQDLTDYYAKQDIPITEKDYTFLLDKADVQSNHSEIVFLDFPTAEEKFRTALPYYPLSIAAGELLNSGTPPVPDTWINMEGLTQRKSFDDSMFIAKIQGKSMEPTVGDGSYCLFTRNVLGSRIGKIVLAQKIGLEDVDTGASFTLKRYHSTKVVDEESGWRHERIVLKAENPDYDDIEITAGEADDFSVIAFLVEVLNHESSF
ncbi:MAG TPA: DEAD/DEAH box helicase [Nitrospirae bacterium]|nr:type I restriction enzyme EcoKI subunit R [bacterium BMS3Abin06]HDH10618.1 DEAD/DEAH box helicase [Nitrospirota bacterium]HDZ00258.1 DEAD/DEAH box helicase [Nitrospirota bacterium]